METSELKKNIISGNTAILILFVISVLLLLLLITDTLQSKIVLAIFAISLAILGVLSKGFKKQNN